MEEDNEVTIEEVTFDRDALEGALDAFEASDCTPKGTDAVIYNGIVVAGDGYTMDDDVKVANVEDATNIGTDAYGFDSDTDKRLRDTIDTIRENIEAADGDESFADFVERTFGVTVNGEAFEDRQFSDSDLDVRDSLSGHMPRSDMQALIDNEDVRVTYVTEDDGDTIVGLYDKRGE